MTTSALVCASTSFTAAAASLRTWGVKNDELGMAPRERGAKPRLSHVPGGRGREVHGARAARELHGRRDHRAILGLLTLCLPRQLLEDLEERTPEPRRCEAAAIARPRRTGARSAQRPGGP